MAAPTLNVFVRGFICEAVNGIVTAKWQTFGGLVPGTVNYLTVGVK
jgi:hypothetical protein